MSSRSQTNLVFVTVADNRIGLGHLNRCLSLASAADALGCRPQLLVFGDEGAADRAGLARYPIDCFAVTDLGKPVHAPQADAAIVDMIHPRYFDDGNCPDVLIDALRGSTRVIAAIDSLGEKTLAVRAPEIAADYLVVPYAVDQTDLARLCGVRCKVLSGPDYAFLAPDYTALAFPPPRDTADRVLVTCGGSDPLGWTSVVLLAIEGIMEDLFIRVVVGPLFDRRLSGEIAEHAARSRHRVEIVDAPPSLASHMQWADLAVAASGLTKYELAAAGIPTVLFSIDAAHEEQNRAFASFGVTENIGAMPPADAIASAVRGLLVDKVRRLAFYNTARRLVDGRGAERLITKLMKEWPC